MKRWGVTGSTIWTLWQRELRNRGREQAEIADNRQLLKYLFDGLFDRCWHALHKGR